MDLKLFQHEMDLIKRKQKYYAAKTNANAISKVKNELFQKHQELNAIEFMNNIELAVGEPLELKEKLKLPSPTIAKILRKEGRTEMTSAEKKLSDTEQLTIHQMSQGVDMDVALRNAAEYSFKRKFPEKISLKEIKEYVFYKKGDFYVGVKTVDGKTERVHHLVTMENNRILNQNGIKVNYGAAPNNNKKTIPKISKEKKDSNESISLQETVIRFEKMAANTKRPWWQRAWAADQVKQIESRIK